MESDREEGRAKRVFRSAGRGVGRGTVGLLNWSIGHILKIVMPVILVIVAVLTFIWGGGYYWQVLRIRWAGDQVQQQLKPLTRSEIDETNLACGLRMGWEDGNTDEERLFALIAGSNLSEEMHTGLCDISRKFWTLRAPGHPVFKSAYRPTEEVDNFKGWSKEQLAQYNQLKIDFQAYQENPKPLQEKYPWLTCVTRYQRTTYAPLYPWPDKQLDKTMKLVFTSPGGAKYFCPK